MCGHLEMTNRNILVGRRSKPCRVFFLESERMGNYKAVRTLFLKCIYQMISFFNWEGFLASKPITRHLVVSARPSNPTVPNDTEHNASSTQPVYKNPPRYRHPQEALKHRFMPVGSLAPTEQSAIYIDEELSQDVSHKKRKTAENPPSSPKKSKKAA